MGSNKNSCQHLLYTELAWLYDRMYQKIFHYEEFFQMIRPYLERVRARRVLEAACGTGRLMAILEENGYEVTGLDLSEDMLRIAGTRCRGRLVRQDIRDIRFSETFDAVTCMGRSFTYMHTEEDVDKALASFNRVLRQGGMFVFDNFDAEKINFDYFSEWRETVFDLDDAKVTRRSINSDYCEENNSWTTNWIYIIERDGEKRVLEDHSRIRAFTKSYLASKLEEHGFRAPTIVDLYGNFMMSAEKG
jgi:ubiquinone/menaquinone biosynthesis C-methylase UbiE